LFYFGPITLDVDKHCHSQHTNDDKYAEGSNSYQEVFYRFAHGYHLPADYFAEVGCILPLDSWSGETP
jgi:hypothetical protein